MFYRRSDSSCGIDSGGISRNNGLCLLDGCFLSSLDTVGSGFLGGLDTVSRSLACCLGGKFCCGSSSLDFGSSLLVLHTLSTTDRVSLLLVDLGDRVVDMEECLAHHLTHTVSIEFFHAFFCSRILDRVLTCHKGKVNIVAEAVFLGDGVVAETIDERGAKLTQHGMRHQRPLAYLGDGIAVALPVKDVSVGLGISQSGSCTEVEVDGVAVGEGVEGFHHTQGEA